MDKYGTGQDPYCYPHSTTLRNCLNIHDQEELISAERELTLLATDGIQFAPPPYDLAYLQALHHQLFADLYPWAGELRTIDIAKGETRFCHAARIKPEARKYFDYLAKRQYFTDLGRDALIEVVAEFYGDLNVVHPFREGNGRAQRLLFEHIIINCGYEISWQGMDSEEWLRANIAAYHCDYRPMIDIFGRCIGKTLSE